MCQGGVFCLEHNMLGWLDGIQMPDKWDWLVRVTGFALLDSAACCI